MLGFAQACTCFTCGRGVGGGGGGGDRLGGRLAMGHSKKLQIKSARWMPEVGCRRHQHEYELCRPEHRLGPAPAAQHRPAGRVRAAWWGADPAWGQDRNAAGRGGGNAAVLPMG